MKILISPGDWARAAGYVCGIVWAATFLAFTPPAYTEGLEIIIIVGWMAITVAGSLLALAGVILGIDIKLELPGIVVMAIGPTLYFLTQGFLAVNGEPGREALTVFAFWHLILLSPRAVELISDARKAKLIAIEKEHGE
jgi:hypothetical protein